MTHAQPNDPAAHPHAAGTGLTPHEQLPRPLFVKLAVLLAVAGTILMVGSIGWRWYHVRFPNTAVLIRGDPSADGARVAVTDEDGRRIAGGALGADNQYQLVVLVEPGMFVVRANRDGQSLLATRLYVRAGGTGAVLLEVKGDPAAGPRTRPATPPAAARAPPAAPPGE